MTDVLTWNEAAVLYADPSTLRRPTGSLAVRSYAETAQCLFRDGLADRVLSRQEVERIERRALRKLREGLRL